MAKTAEGETSLRRRAARWAAGLLVAASTIAPVGAAEEASLDDTLANLAETLGALQHLRPLCGAQDGNAWRDQMNAVLDAVQPTREKRLAIVDRFNQSYRGSVAAQRGCTAAARLLAETYRKRGEALGRDILTRWGHT